MTSEQRTREQLKLQFTELLKDLNPAQLRAVQHIEGPTLVIAGPGTGKTHLVVSRIANILTQTDTPAQSILCLTFSDAGATAMRNRMIKLIGTDAHKITVSTYHAFSSRVMNEHPELFGKGKEMQLLSDLERSEWLSELLDVLPQEHMLFRKYKGELQIKGRLGHLFGVMKREQWSVEWFSEKIKQRLHDLPNDIDLQYRKKYRNYQAGDLKPAAYADAVEKLILLQSGVDLYANWQKMLAEKHRYEYDDMVAWVANALETNANLKAQLQERYLYVVVDEYQDTNATQNKLVRLLIDYWEEPNIFIVGDDDQSIYEFQGARLRNLIEFYEQYKEFAEVVVLQENYRSGQPILDVAKRVIDPNQLRALPLLNLGVEKVLKAQQKHIFQPEVLAFENEFAELHWVVDQIEAAIATGLSIDEIAVIYRNNKSGERVAALLRQRGIAYTTRKEVDILSLPFMQQLNLLIEWVVQELRNPLEGDALHFQLLHAPFFHLSSLDLALVMAHKRNTAPDTSLRVLLQDEAWLASTGIKQVNQMLEVSAKFEQIIKDAANLPLLRFWNELLNQTGALAWSMQDAQSVYWIQVLHTFSVFLEDEVRRASGIRVQQLPSLLRSMQALGLKLPLIATAQAAKGVQLLTAHGSKGLEFDTVFVYSCTQQEWQKTSSGSNLRFTFPPNVTLSGEEDATEAQRRLFYVAMTRAKRRLYMGFSRRDIKLKDLAPCQFILETELPIQEVQIEPSEVAACQAIVMRNEDQIKVELPRLDVIKAFVEDYTLSLSGLNLYLRCPLAFYYEKILKLPDVQSDAAQFGSQMHAALEQFFIRRNVSKNQDTVDLSVLKSLFRAQMQMQQHRFNSVADFKSKLEYGLSCLEGYYSEHSKSWPQKVRIEQKIDRVTIDGVPVTGVIDRIDLLGGTELRVVDYKTGKLKSEKVAQPHEDKQVYGGDYYRQGLFYKLLADAAPHLPGAVNEVVFSYLEPDKGKYKEYKIDLDRDALNWMRNLVGSTWKKIQQMEFEMGCGEKDCIYCNLHRTGQLDAERLEEEYALDD